MLTVVITAVIVIVLAILLYTGRGRARGRGGQGLKRRFGPEYARTVADHDGDTRAAEQELGARVKEHGSLTEQPLTPAARERYVTRWAAVQEQFVESPQQAVTEADALLARLARDRGFLDGERFEDQIAALSVHHAHYVQGYRSMHAAARGQSGTEEMREAMVEARSLFEALVTEQPTEPPRPSAPDGQGHAPWPMTRRHAKGNST
ncbi:hypothetical protein [Streptomyces viridochromogenes]|uniref:hypothetical protein n=1 Tax=Streptomyces viridochromogenes TaxID=1938 RepID=UPI00069FF384|nr:hypothetical protein [Streptomyces viridochromogenes]KOG10494.1 hypothetical protein ADK35_37735 [Streptomyces viridochromogenes]KOG18598.1 hypothetical protein ADK36_21560 [Streptomyces viridochromogenes]